MSVGFKTHYFEELAKLEAGSFWFRARNRLILWAIKQYAPKLKCFLEIGCGTGFVISSVSKYFPSVKVSGSEYFEDGLVYARQRLPNAEFTQMDARRIPYNSEFDAIGVFDVLEHIEEDEVVLQQIFKALRPEGTLFITVPQHDWLWSEVDEHACHVRRYSESDLRRKVCNAGFRVVRSTSFVSFLLPVMYLSRVLKIRMDVKVDAKAELRINPVLNKVFEWILNIEVTLIRIGFNWPFGGSRLLIAEKPLMINKDS
jgi:trans-aconitate methyltransferase